jgi:hypothetical protein
MMAINMKKISEDIQIFRRRYSEDKRADTAKKIRHS